MPFASQAQARAMYAAANSRPSKARKSRIDPEVAKKFIADSKGQKLSALPERVKPKR